MVKYSVRWSGNCSQVDNEFQFGRLSFFKKAANRRSLCKFFRRGSTVVPRLGSRCEQARSSHSNALSVWLGVRETDESERNSVRFRESSANCPKRYKLPGAGLDSLPLPGFLKRRRLRRNRRLVSSSSRKPQFVNMNHSEFFILFHCHLKDFPWASP